MQKILMMDGKIASRAPAKLSSRGSSVEKWRGRWRLQLRADVTNAAHAWVLIRFPARLSRASGEAHRDVRKMRPLRLHDARSMCWTYVHSRR